MLAAVPAAAHSFGFSVSGTPACLTIGETTWRMTDGRADMTVRIDATSPNVAIQLVDTPDEADFVFADDGDAPSACRDRGTKSVKIDPAASAPDLVMAFTTGSADYRVYARSNRLSPETAAALYAASQAHRAPVRNTSIR